MAYLTINPEGIKTVLFLLAEIADKNGELSAAELKLQKQCLRAQTPIKTSSAKAKGRDLQQFICRELARMSGLVYNQSNDQCLIHSREMGQAGTDVVLRGKALAFFPFSIECKNCESFSLWPTIEQAENNKKTGTDFLVVHKKKGKQPIVIMAWDAFAQWYCSKGYLLLKKEVLTAYEKPTKSKEIG